MKPISINRTSVNQFAVLVLMLMLPAVLMAGRADSLRRVISHSLSEADRLHAMCLLAIELMPDSMERAEHLLLEAAPLEKKGNDVQIAAYYNASGIFHRATGNRWQAIASFKNTLTLPDHPSIIDDKAMAANSTGNLFRMFGEIDSAKVYFHKTLEIDIQREFKPGIAKTQFDLALLYELTSQYHLALKYILEAIKTQEEVGSLMGVMFSYNVLGIVYARFDSTAKAAQYFHKGLKLAEESGRTELILSYLNNLLSMNAEQPDSLERSLEYFQRGKALSEKQQDYKNRLAMQTNMARAFDAANEPETAASFYKMGLDYLDKVDNYGFKAQFLYSYGNHLLRNNEIAIAGDKLHSALHFAELSGETLTKMQIYRALASVDSINGNYMEALKHLHQSFAIRDSIYTVKKSASIAEIQILHNIHQYEQMLADLKSESRLDKLRFRFSVVLGIAGVVMFGLWVAYFRKRKKIAEMTLKSKELEHTKLLDKYETNRQVLTGNIMSLMNSERLIKKLQVELKSYLDHADDECRHKLQPVIKELKAEDKSKELW